VRYLVTGGLGVVGSRIAGQMLAAGHQVVIVDACESRRNEWVWAQLQPLKPEVYAQRLESSRMLTTIVQSCDAVIHCAASTGIPWSVENPDDDWRSNVDGMRALLDALRVAPRPLVSLSSIKPYRVPTPGNFPFHGLDESAVLDPDEPYAASKAAQSMLCVAYARSYGLPVVTFRCSNLYGPAPCHGPRHGWLTWFCISAAIGRPIEVQGTGEQSRDMLHADDVHSACRFALSKADELSGQVFNLGGGRRNEVSVNWAASWLAERTGVEVRRAPARAMDDAKVYVDHAAFTRATGWEPQVNVVEGMADVLRWAQANKAELAKLYGGV
jgi:CDP-paratose 2-epimerase